ncbi:MAG: DUF177 domain-containing protein [Geminicoccaceae bacterium]
MSIPVEFSRPLAVDSVPPEGKAVHLLASPAECDLLAKRLELIDLGRLEGEVLVQPVEGTAAIHVSGHLAADVVQSCVVTLDPVPARVEAEFDRLFSRDVPVEADGEVEVDPEGDAPEPLAGATLDLGEILAQELSLAMDPYPRAADADEQLSGLRGEEAGGQRSPFAALDALRRH